MKSSDIEKLSEPLRDQRVTHLLLVKLRSGIILSSIASGNDLFEFLQVLADNNPVALEIMQEVLNSRKRTVIIDPSAMLN